MNGKKDDEDSIYFGNYYRSLFLTVFLWVVTIISFIFSIISMHPLIFGLSFVLIFFSVLSIIVVYRNRRDAIFLRWFVKRVAQYPNWEYLGDMPEHLRELTDNSNYGLNRYDRSMWWVRIEFEGHIVYTGTFYRQMSSLLSPGNAPPKFFLTAIVEHPMVESYVSFYKEPWGPNMTKEMGLWKYKYNNKDFENKYNISSDPKEKAKEVLTEELMNFILNEFRDQEFFIGRGMLVISDEIKAWYLYSSAEDDEEICVLERWNNTLPDKIIRLQKTLLGDSYQERLIAIEN